MSTSAETAHAALPAASNVLVKEVNWLGDLVMSLPALRAVRRAFPGRLSVLVKQELAGFFDGLRWVDRVIAYRIRPGVRGLADRRRVVATLRAERFDLAVLFPKSFEAALWTMLGGIRRRAGFSTQGRGPLLTHRAAPAEALGERHQAELYLQMLRDTLGITGTPEDCQLDVGERRRAAMREWLQSRRRHPELPLIALAPGAAYGPAKEWPSARYAALLERLETRAECVLVGAPAERPRCEEIASGRAIVAAGSTDVGDLIALLSLCTGFAGNDSGAMHVAGAIGIPTVGIFGSTQPSLTGPRGPRTRSLYRPPACSPCFDRTCRFGHYDCLTGITADEVDSALQDLGAFAPSAGPGVA